MFLLSILLLNSKCNPLIALYSKLDYPRKEEGVSFVGISNYSLRAETVNRALILSVPDLDERVDELIQSSYSIVESISEKLKTDKIFEILSMTYFNYKNILDIIKELIVYKNYVNIINFENDNDDNLSVYSNNSQNEGKN